MDFGIASITNLLASAVVASLTLVVFLGSKKPESRSFALTTFLVTWWIVSHALFHGSQNETVAYVFVRLNFFLGTVIAMTFFYFATTFYNQKHASWQLAIPLVLTGMIFTVLFFGPETSHMILSGVESYAGPQGWSWLKGPMWYFFDIFFIGFWMAGMTMLSLRYFKSEGEERTRNLFMVVSMFVAVAPPLFMNILLPDFGYYALDWVGTLTSLGWVSVLGYSIIKHNQMNVKVVSAEILIITAALLLFFSIFI